jgi:hypothetical protein
VVLPHPSEPLLIPTTIPPTTRKWFVFVVCLFLLWGCTWRDEAFDKNSDNEALDRFSHAYTDFRNAAFVVEIAGDLVASDEESVRILEGMAWCIRCPGHQRQQA